MLQGIPKSIFSWGFEVCDGSGPIAVMDVRWMSEGGDFEYQGRQYELRKAGVLSGEFSLQENSNVIAEATKTTCVRSFDVRYAQQHYCLRAASPFTRRFVVAQDGRIIGEIGPEHPFTRRSRLDLPENVPVPVQVFMFWLVILMWRRASNSAAAS